MNIFILDEDIKRCAQFHCDSHVSKMILESVQIMCTALWEKGFQTPYRPTHARHPCVLWAGQSYDNFLWLGELARELNDEYRYRYDKQRDHASIAVLKEISQHRFESRGLTEFVQAMPEAYKIPGDAVEAYRRFYRGEKHSFAKWTLRPKPHWWHTSNRHSQNKQYTYSDTI